VVYNFIADNVGLNSFSCYCRPIRKCMILTSTVYDFSTRVVDGWMGDST